MYQITWKCTNPLCFNKEFKEIVMEKRRLNEFNWCSYCNKFTLKLEDRISLSLDAVEAQEVDAEV